MAVRTDYCTLLARWDDGYTDPWLILTDLDSTNADIGWYGFRSWIECSYRDIKSDGWKWHKTRLRQPKRAERLWLAMSVAMLWMVTLGGEQEISAHGEVIGAQLDSQALPDRSSFSQPTINRSLSCFLNGLLTVVAQLLNGQSLSFGRLFPFPFNDFSHLSFSNSS